MKSQLPSKISSKIKEYVLINRIDLFKQMLNNGYIVDATLIDYIINASGIDIGIKLKFMLALAEHKLNYQIKIKKIEHSEISETSIKEEELDSFISLKLEQSGHEIKSGFDVTDIIMDEFEKIMHQRLPDIGAKYKSNDSEGDARQVYISPFAEFKYIIRQPLRFGTTSNEFYNMLINQLCEILFIMSQDGYATEALKDEKLKELMSQLSVCGPGITSSILEIKSTLFSSGLKYELAKMHQKVLQAKSLETTWSSTSPDRNMDIHAEAAYCLAADKAGYYIPMTEHKHRDQFMGLIYDVKSEKEIEMEVEALLDDKDHLDQVTEFLILQLTEELVPIFEDVGVQNVDFQRPLPLTFEQYKDIADRMNPVLFKYGLSSDLKSSNRLLWQSAEDDMSMNFMPERLLYCLVEALIKVKAIEAQEMSISNGDESGKYVVLGSSVFLYLTNKKTGVEEIHYDADAIHKIFELSSESKNDVNLLMAAIYQDKKTIANGLGEDKLIFLDSSGNLPRRKMSFVGVAEKSNQTTEEPSLASLGFKPTNRSQS